MALELAMFFKRNLVSLFVVFGLGVLWASVLDAPDSYSWAPAGALAIAIYFATSLLLWAINGISGAIYIWLFFERDITLSVLDGLQNLKIPPPKRHDEKSVAYFLVLANDNTAAIPDRLKAASFAAAFEATKSGMSHFRALAYTRAANAAVERFYLEQGFAGQAGAKS